jgi:superfamily I DNA and/or RNA helicase
MFTTWALPQPTTSDIGPCILNLLSRNYENLSHILQLIQRLVHNLKDRKRKKGGHQLTSSKWHVFTLPAALHRYSQTLGE